MRGHGSTACQCRDSVCDAGPTLTSSRSSFTCCFHASRVFCWMSRSTWHASLVTAVDNDVRTKVYERIQVYNPMYLLRKTSFGGFRSLESIIFSKKLSVLIIETKSSNTHYLYHFYRYTYNFLVAQYIPVLIIMIISIVQIFQFKSSPVKKSTHFWQIDSFPNRNILCIISKWSKLMTFVCVVYFDRHLFFSWSAILG